MTKRKYPLLKTCEVCPSTFEVADGKEARRKTCSPACRSKLIAEIRRISRKPASEHKGKVSLVCPECGGTFYRQKCWIRGQKQTFCSRECSGVVRGQEWAKHGHKGRAAWTEKNVASFRQKMSGANNPAWRGGVTYHNNGSLAKYVACPKGFLSMARKDGYVAEHRLKVAQAIGRLLTSKEVVHHMDRDPHNNALENLALFASQSDHKRFEHHGLPLPIWQGSDACPTEALSGV